jgi:hypothetical protein
MTLTAAHVPLEELFRWEEVVEGPVAVSEEPYEAPEALVEKIEESEEKVIHVFYVLVAYLLTLAAALAVAVVIYCWRKGGSLAYWVRLSRLRVKVACRIRR